MLYIIFIPYIWDQIGLQLVMSTVGYVLVTIAGFMIFMPFDILTTTVYLHYVIYLFKKVELKPESNLVEIVQLEQ